MKITNLSLLKAMQYADEKLVEQTAPFDDADTDEMPGTARFAEVTRRTRITRRVMEAAALCAAVVFCVLAVYGISRLNRTENPRTYADSTPEEDAKAAREVVNAYLNAILENTSASRKNALSLSLIEKLDELEENEDDPYRYLPDKDDVPQWCSIPDDYDGENMDRVREEIKFRQLNREYEYLRALKEGLSKEEADEYYNPENDVLLNFYKTFERYYVFPLTYMDKEGDEYTTDTIAAIRIDTVWYVYPYDLFYYRPQKLTDEETADLAKWKQEFAEMGLEQFAGSPFLTDCPLEDFSGDSRILVKDSNGGISERDADTVKKLANVLLNAQWQKFFYQPILPDGEYSGFALYVYNGGDSYELECSSVGNAVSVEYTKWYEEEGDMEPTFHSKYFGVSKDVYQAAYQIVEENLPDLDDAKRIGDPAPGDKYHSMYEYWDAYSKRVMPPGDYNYETIRIRFADPEYAPYLLEYNYHSSTRDLFESLAYGLWREAPDDLKPSENDRITVYFWQDGKPFSLTFCADAIDQDCPVIYEAKGEKKVYLMNKNVREIAYMLGKSHETALKEHYQELVSVDADVITYESAWTDLKK